MAQTQRAYRARKKQEVNAAAREAHSANLASTPKKPKVLTEALAIE